MMQVILKMKYKIHLRNWFTMRNICINQALMKLTYTNLVYRYVMLYACLHLCFEGDKSTKGEEEASSKRIHRSQTCVGSSQNLRQFLFAANSKRIREKLHVRSIKVMMVFFRVEIQYFSTLQCMFLAHYLAQYFVCNLFLELIVQTFRQCAVIMQKRPVQWGVKIWSRSVNGPTWYQSYFIYMYIKNQFDKYFMFDKYFSTPIFLCRDTCMYWYVFLWLVNLLKLII